MAASGSTGVPFSLVDEAIFSRDRVDEPWTVHVETAIAGEISVERLRVAIAAASLRHPVTRARMARPDRRKRRYEWIVDAVSNVPFDACTVDSGGATARRDAFVSQPFDLEDLSPVRVLLLREDGVDRIVVSASHVATDGVGAIAFLRSIDRAYSAEPDPTDSVDSMTARDLHASLDRTAWRGRIRRLVQSAALLKDGLDPPTRLAPDGGQPGAGYGVHMVALTVAETTRLVGLTSRADVTVNDVLLAALHRAVETWNEGVGFGCKRVSTMMPVNLRPPGSRDDVMGNLSMMVPISSRVEQRRDGATLLRAIADQTRAAKSNDRGRALLEAMSIGSNLPVGVRQRVHSAVGGSERLTDTSVLSNLGRIDAPLFGLEPQSNLGLWFSAPCGMPNGLVVGAATSGRRLRLAFRFRTALLDHAGASRFGDIYAEAVLGYLDAG